MYRSHNRAAMRQEGATMDREAFAKLLVVFISEMAGETWHVPDATETEPSLARKREKTLEAMEFVMLIRPTLEFDHTKLGHCTIYAVGAPTRLVVVGIDAFRIHLDLTRELANRTLEVHDAVRRCNLHRLRAKPVLVPDSTPQGIWYESEPLTYIVVTGGSHVPVWERICVFGDVQYDAGVPVSVTASTITRAVLDGYARRVDLLEQLRTL